MGSSCLHPLATRRSRGGSSQSNSFIMCSFMGAVMRSAGRVASQLWTTGRQPSSDGWGGRGSSRQG